MPGHNNPITPLIVNNSIQFLSVFIRPFRMMSTFLLWTVSLNGYRFRSARNFPPATLRPVLTYYPFYHPPPLVLYFIVALWLLVSLAAKHRCQKIRCKKLLQKISVVSTYCRALESHKTLAVELFTLMQSQTRPSRILNFGD